VARGIDGGPVGRDALVRSMPIWRGWNELRGVSRRFRGGAALEETRWVSRSLASSRETEEVKEGNQARRRREGHAP